MGALRGMARGVWWAAGGAVALLLSVAGRHGFHRDEVYFVVAGRRLDWGFVDQPPLTPLVARVSELVAGTSPFALRILPALSVGVTAVLAGAMARRFGGGRAAQTFAAFASGWAGFALGAGHLLSTAAFEYVLWTAAALILVHVLDGAHHRWWLALGGVVGIGLQNKHLIGVFAVAVLVGLVATSQRRVLANRWPWLGVAIAAAIALPNLLWQAANGWPQLEMAEALADRSDGALAFVMLQPLLLSISLAVPAAVGLWRLLRSPDLERFRSLGIAFVVLFVVFLVSGGKAYYVAPMYPTLLAAGSGWFEDLARGPRRTMAVVAGLGVAVGLFIGLPLLPVSSASALDVTGEIGETVGWPEMVEQVAAVYEAIPPERRIDVTIFTGSYGEAGAIDVLGPDFGLPGAVSGHNTYWLWGPPERHGPVIGVSYTANIMRLICSDVEQVGTITNPHGVENEVAGAPLFLCVEPDRQLADIWDDVRHYN